MAAPLPVTSPARMFPSNVLPVIVAVPKTATPAPPTLADVLPAIVESVIVNVPPAEMPAP